jgi:hypothetical protein
MTATSQNPDTPISQNPDATWGEEIALRPSGTGPIVFHFRPTKYLLVKKEKRAEWEAMFRKYVGAVPDKALLPELRQHRGDHAPVPELRGDYPWSGDPHETISGSGDGWDDCDYW